MPPANALLGIDVSSNQSAVDWNAVAQSNVSFAYARASLGAQSGDKQFSANWPAIRAAGLLRGAYHFFWPLASVSDQLSNYTQAVGTLASGDLPPMVDLEPTSSDPTKDVWPSVPQNTRLPMILGWLTAIEQAVGLRPIVYTYKSFIENLLGADLQQLSGYPLWIAHYTNAAQPTIPAVWNNWTIWQYAETGKVNGVNGNVDLDCFNGALSDLQALAKP